MDSMYNGLYSELTFTHIHWEELILKLPPYYSDFKYIFKKPWANLYFCTERKDLPHSLEKGGLSVHKLH